VETAVSDKLLHFASFGVLGFLALRSWGTAFAALIFLGLSLLGLGIEFAQALPMIARESELGDWLADILGIVLGILLAQLMEVFNDHSAG
jgi:VanZ family protein